MPRRRKSDPLTTEEIKALKQYRKTFHTELDCAEAIGIRRELLSRILIVGSASPETVAKIRAAISKPENIESNGAGTEGSVQ